MCSYLNIEIRIMTKNFREYDKLLNIMKKIANKECENGNYAILMEWMNLSYNFTNKINKCEDLINNNNLNEIIDLNSEFISMKLYLSELIDKIKHGNYGKYASIDDYVYFCSYFFEVNSNDSELENNNTGFNDKRQKK